MSDESRIRMLIADDEPISRKLLEKLLAEKVDADLLVACDGQEAWEIVRERPVHMVIADWMMPRMDGLELCKKIRQANFPYYVYTILVTARDNQQDVVRGLHAGADDYIRKPFNPSELELRINTGLRLVRLEEQLSCKNDQLETLNKKLEKLARIDPLMKIGNRNSFYESIERIHSRAVRYDRCYGLLICDVDHFKLYNDTRGHQAGDQALSAVAKAIKTTIRTSDEVFRFGGEEIVILLPEQDLDGTFRSAQRVRQAVEDLGIVHPNGVGKVLSICVGAAIYGGSDQSHCHWKQILERADHALYRAKDAGRNRVCKWTHTPLASHQA